MQRDTRPTLLDRIEAAPDAEVVAVLAATICDGKAGTMMREAEMFLASVCASSW